MTPKYDIDLVIAKYLSGESNPEDIVLLSRWLEEEPVNREVFRQTKGYWNSQTISTLDGDPAGGFEAILERIRENGGNDKRRGRSRRGRIVRFIGIAAMLALVAGGISLYYHLNPATVKYYSYHTGESVSEFSLPDGTVVSLNKNSSLSFSESYGAGNREVSLRGEAWFDVTHDDDNYFSVDMGDARIMVLGTRFIASYNDAENIVTASLVDGSIRFVAKDQSILLSPNNRLEYDRATGELHIEGFDPEIETAWKDNLIRYKSMPFGKFVGLLRNTYNVDIWLHDSSLDNILISGSIDARQSVEQVLDMIKYAVPYRWKRENGGYVITPEKYRPNITNH